MEGKTNVLIFDFGGGTLDCTLLQIEQGNFTVLGTKGDTHLGGEDVDNILVSHCVKEFEKATGIDVSKSAKSMRRLKTACELAKKELSTSTEYEITIDSLAKDEDFELTITRD